MRQNGLMEPRQTNEVLAKTSALEQFFSYYPEGCRFRVNGDVLTKDQLKARAECGDTIEVAANPEIDDCTENGHSRFFVLNLPKTCGPMRLPGLRVGNQEGFSLVLRKNGHSPSTWADLQSQFIEALHRHGVEAQVANHVILTPGLEVTTSSEDLAAWLAQPCPESLQELLDFDTSKDPDALINEGKRFLCRGGSFLVTAPSGIGKSVFVVQMAVTWAMGKPFFGLQARAPLKGLLMQAENDRGDLAEMLQGVKEGLGLNLDEISMLNRNLAIYSRPQHKSGETFCTLLEDLITAHSPDVVYVDPLFAFIEGDLSSQELGSAIFRRQIDPILRRHRCVLVSVHHTPKPTKERLRRRAYDYSYLGFGTSELTNWHRAIASLEFSNPKEGLFEFRVSKRGERADLAHGGSICWIKHCQKGRLFWELAEKPAQEGKSKGRVSEDTLLSWAAEVCPARRQEILQQLMTKLEIKGRQVNYYWNRIKSRLERDSRSHKYHCKRPVVPGAPEPPQVPALTPPQVRSKKKVPRKHSKRRR